MKVNVKLDIDDRERDVLANFIDGKITKRLATRKDVVNFVGGCVDSAIMSRDDDETARLKELGFDAAYIRGWMQVGDRICNKA